MAFASCEVSGVATNMKDMHMNRSLSVIAREIRADWPRPYFGAVPYLDAMASLSSVDDKYIYDDGRTIVRYFLSNASAWRGDTARRIKAELKAML
jgi:hypothetical protein